MRELEENILREHIFSDNAEKMKVVRKNFKTARQYNVYLNLAVILFSFASVYLWLSFTNAGIRMAHRLDEEIGVISFPGAAVSALFAPAITIMSYFADVYLIKKLNRFSQLLYLIILLFSLSNLILRYEPMKILDMILLILYSMLGLWTQDFAVRSYKDLDYLSTQEGFPDFNYLIEKDRHSRFVKYREKWLNQNKKLDYFTENEKPTQDYEVIKSEENTMDGISVQSDICSDWFDNKSNADTSNSESFDGMDILETDEIKTELPDESEYVIEDPRRRPL